MLERYPVLTIFLLFAALMVFGILATWLWLSVGLIWASVLVIGALLFVPWLFQHRPRFLGGGHSGHA
ncbi:MAG: hypothetical protein WD557_13390 [Dehalococcoidia bacterium]